MQMLGQPLRMSEAKDQANPPVPLLDLPQLPAHPTRRTLSTD